MKRWTWFAVLILGILVGAAAVWLGTAEGIAADEERRGGNAIPYMLMFGVGLAATLAGIIGLLTSSRRIQQG
ncbi:hypothetical protein [Agromyces sp. NPDC058126]|uniref:hypothetical protein n=1 Tax=Agromyces sp. NPDC058126 TaxID=3346350 RepID=UPI0036DF6799